jgi:peptide/nickel transport system permease protein
MRAYVIKRLLLMVPTLFGISVIVWAIVTAAPGEAGQAPASDAQSARGGDVRESRRIFRRQFNLDKPLFFNDYVSLEPSRVLDAVRRANDPGLKPSERRKPQEALDDWHTFAVPGLIASLDLAKTPGERALVLLRLPTNAKRIAAPRMGRPLTEAEKQENRDIQAETREIEDRLTLNVRGVSLEELAKLSTSDADPKRQALLREIESKSAAWKAWYELRRKDWDWSTGEKWKIRLFDTRFAKYWDNLRQFDLGDSHVHKEPVLRLIVKRLPISLTLSVVSLILAYLLSVPLGIWSAVQHKTPAEQAVTTLLFMLYSLPTFFTASLLLKFLAIDEPWKIIPVSGFESDDSWRMTTIEHVLDVLHHVMAPLFCMTYVSLAGLSRYAKSGILNVIRSDYVRTARAKGLTEKTVILKHTVRNGIIPIVTLLGATLPVIVSGSIVIETVFGIPGIGLLLIESILQRDYNVVIGESLLVAILTMVGILLSDLLYAVVDPRIRFE